MKPLARRGLRVLALMTIVFVIDAAVAAQGHTVPFGFGTSRQGLSLPR